MKGIADVAIFDRIKLDFFSSAFEMRSNGTKTTDGQLLCSEFGCPSAIFIDREKKIHSHTRERERKEERNTVENRSMETSERNRNLFGRVIWRNP